MSDTLTAPTVVADGLPVINVSGIGPCVLVPTTRSIQYEPGMTLREALDAMNAQIVESAAQVANHERRMGTADDAGHIKLGAGFEHLPDGTVNINGIADFQAALSDLDKRKADVSVTVAAIIGTTWTGSAPPYTQTISISGVTETNIVDITLPKSAAQLQIEQYQALNWTDGGQVTGKVTLRAWGDKNTVVIPITAIVRG